VGIGASYALACDIRIAVPEAYLLEAFINIGLAPTVVSAGSCHDWPEPASPTRCSSPGSRCKLSTPSGLV